MVSTRNHFTLAELAAQCGGESEGSPEIIVSAAASAENAESGAIVFALDDHYLDAAEKSKASAVLISKRSRPSSKPAIRASNVRLAWSRLLTALYPAPRPAPGIHATSVIHPSARIAPDASIGPLCSVGPGAEIGDRCSVGAGSVIGSNVTIGADSVIYPRVVIGDGCILGPRNLILAGAVVGAEGFGLARDGDRYVRVPHIGIVRTGCDVEIGANTAVDRAALGETIIGDGVKIDNLVQIAHNVTIGANTVIAAQTGIAGSSRVGQSVTMAGQVGIIDHVTIGERAVLTAQSVVIGNVDAGSVVGGFPARPHREFLRSMAALRRLPSLLKQWPASEDTEPQRRERAVPAGGSGDRVNSGATGGSLTPDGRVAAPGTQDSPS